MRGSFSKFLDDIKKTVEKAIQDNLPLVARIVAEEQEKKKATKRKFVVLMDFENFDKNRKISDELRDISWLTTPIFEVGGEIEKMFVFLPEHLRNSPPIVTLSNLHRFFAVICPRMQRYEGDHAEKVGTKDTDTVDARMEELGFFLIGDSRITDVVMITGDKGFQRLLKTAEYHGKHVWIFSARDALSMRYALQVGNSNFSLVIP